MRSTWSLRAVLLVALAASMAASSAVAQRSTTRGFMLGGYLQAASLSVDDGDPDSGGGFGLRAGYGFNRHFTGYFEVDAIVFDVANPEFGGYWSMVHADVGLRYNFANSLRRWIPFLETALGARGVNVDDARVNGQRIGELNFSGGAFSLGGGSFLLPDREAGHRNGRQVHYRHVRADRRGQRLYQQRRYRCKFLPLEAWRGLVAVMRAAPVHFGPRL